MEKVKIEVLCPICKKVHFVEVNKDKELLAIKVRQREIHVRDAFPELSDSDRELLISGIDDECWKRLFPDDEDII